MIDKLTKFLSALPPEALPVLSRLADAGIKLAQRDPKAALAELQAAERKANALVAKAILRKARK
jgi:hypothetical protein